MKELRRRQAAATGRPLPDEPGNRDAEDDGEPEDIADDDDAPRANSDEELDPDRPIPLRPPPVRRRGPGPSDRGPVPPRPPRGPSRRSGGARDGGRSIRSRVLTIVAILVAVFIALMLVVGIQLWTDAIWYRSVGYDAVFWT